MLPINLFRNAQERERIIAGLKKKHVQNLDIVDEIIALDEKKRQVQAISESLTASMNQASKSIGALMAQGKKDEAEAAKKEVAAKKSEAAALQQELASLEAKLEEKLVSLPNLPHSSVPEGKTAEDNEVVRTGGSIPELGAEALPHWDICSKYDIIDFELGNKVTGSGFPFYKGKGARLQRALVQYFLDYNTDAGFLEIQPPIMVNEASAYGTGQLPDKEGQMYHATEDNFYLIPTAEVPVTNVFRDEIVKAEQLPIKMTAYTPCFRREAGSYGKDVRGLNRLHQFDKVEIVQFVRPEDSYNALEEMVAHVEKLIQSLELPYRILRLCGGDMSFTSALTYDFEVYSSAQQRWLEVSSVSNFESFQTNRMKMRYRNEAGKIELVHSLNGSSLALPRILAAILENNQTEKGIKMPAVLKNYIPFEYID